MQEVTLANMAYRKITHKTSLCPFLYDLLNECCVNVTDIQKNIVYYMKLNIYNILTMDYEFFIIMHNTLA